MRQPVALVGSYAKPDRCCWCGCTNTDGIYKRAAPHETPCCWGIHISECADTYTSAAGSPSFRRLRTRASPHG